MPRLRYLKKYEYIETGDENGTLESFRGRTAEENRFEAGNSWLSNARIISSLPTDKIKQAISYHRQMAHLLEAELSARALGYHVVNDSELQIPRQNYYENDGQSRYFARQSGGSFNGTRRLKKGIFQGLGLNTKLRKQLEEELNDLWLRMK